MADPQQVWGSPPTTPNDAPNPLGAPPTRWGPPAPNRLGAHPQHVGGTPNRLGVHPQPVGGHPQPVGGGFRASLAFFWQGVPRGTPLPAMKGPAHQTKHCLCLVCTCRACG